MARAEDYSNEMMVEDVTLSWFYTPHSLLALGVTVALVTGVALEVDAGARSMLENARVGAAVAALVFCVMGMLVFPSGPFTRPHPVLWRLVFAISVMYLMMLLLLLFQSLEGARASLLFFDDGLNVPLIERSYAADCSLTPAVLWDAVYDRYVLAHFFGWVVNALMLRDRRLCWIASLTWELVEISLTHWLPNFAECWWDQLILDVLLCNGIGIEVGTRICSYLEVREYHWTGVMDYPTVMGKAKRVMQQFSPASWTTVRWEPWSSWKRFFTAHILLAGMLCAQLNGFFLKQLLWIPSEHNLNLVRLLLWTAISAPTMRQFYLYHTRPDVKRMGVQLWVFLAILTTEILCIVKFSRNQFPASTPSHVWTLWKIIGGLYLGLCFVLLTRSRAKSKVY